MENMTDEEKVEHEKKFKVRQFLFYVKFLYVGNTQETSS